MRMLIKRILANPVNNFAIKSVFKLTLTKSMCVCVCVCVCVFMIFSCLNALKITAYWCQMALSIPEGTYWHRQIHRSVKCVL